MRSTHVVALVIWAGLGLGSIAAAQTVTGPTIHNVTLHEGEGVLTITGIGFGREPVVTVDGQPVTVLPMQQMANPQQQLQEQQALIADLRARLARVEALLVPAEGHK